MNHKRYKFSSAATDYYFDARFSNLKKIVDQRNAIIITDTNLYKKQKPLFTGWKCIVLKAGEKYKVQATVDSAIKKLIGLGADRQTVLVGVGGGVITDLTGYIASIYLRGISFGFVPTSLLAIVDAAIGGKNGVDVGVYKNMVGNIRQPQFLLYDTSLLATLPVKEWKNGFAEIIKHSCIKDGGMFRELEKNKLEDYVSHPALLSNLVKRNARLKTRVVQADEFEKGERRLLNFGHTLGHALENQYGILHGHAVSIGMVAACRISSGITGFNETERVESILRKYGLPVTMDFDKGKTFEILSTDKKRVKREINYIMLRKIGDGIAVNLSLKKLKSLLHTLD
jgi:3-dehydroquinate synthase